MPQVTIQPEETTVEVPPGTLLLAATRAAGREVDAPCGGKGACGKCLVRVVAGRVQARGRELLARDLACHGYVLACRTRVGEEPVTIEVPQTETHGAFSDGHGDFELLEPGLLPKKEELAPMAGTLTLSVPPPQPEDGLSDLDRLTRAVKKETNHPLANSSPNLFRALPDALREEKGEVALTVTPSPAAAKEDEPLTPIRLTPGQPTTPTWGIAIDLGTTTVAALLADLDIGEVKEISTAYNRQVSCGLDVISRINYARGPEHLEELRTRLRDTVNALAADLAGRHGIEPQDIAAASLAGNTTMTHLLLGIKPEYIRLSPYTPAVLRVPELRAGDLELEINPDAPVHFAPAVGSYVGGDITAGLLCTRMADPDGGPRLFLDIGTNGELVLGLDGLLIGCACSAGPAFEGGGLSCGMRAARGAIEYVHVDPETGMPEYSVIGGTKPAGICGSGIIALLANLLEAKWIDPTGKFDRERKCPALEVEGRTARYRLAEAEESAAGKPLYVTEPDIENVIRAKAAIYSAADTLLEKVGLGFDEIKTFYGAGGFGRFLDIEDARKIGLLPSLPRQKFRYVGNSSLMGAYLALIDRKKRKRQEEIAQGMTYVDLSNEPTYMDRYTAALFLPHTDLTRFPSPAPAPDPASPA